VPGRTDSLLANFLARGVIAYLFALPTPVSVNWSLPAGVNANALTKCSVTVTLHDDEDDEHEHDMSPEGEHEDDEEHEPESLPTSDVNNIRRSYGSTAFSTKIMGIPILPDQSVSSLFSICAVEKSSSMKMRSEFEGCVDCGC
jgi:hypothetical protein